MEIVCGKQSERDYKSITYCSGKSNAADMPSRGQTPTELINNVVWAEGPKWLHEHDVEEGLEVDYSPILPDCLTEL